MKIKKKDLVIIAFALFAMFFGAGNLIFPPYLGLISGSKWTIAVLGFIITAVGLTFLTVVSTASAGGSLASLTERVGKKPAKIISTMIILFIGPLLAIPRTAATSHEVIFYGTSFPPIVTSLVFFSLVLFFSLRDNKIIDNIGRFLTPALLLALTLMIIKGIAYPLGPVNDITSPSLDIFSTGIREGYQTMDLLAASVFTGLVMDSVIQKGYREKKTRIKLTLYSGLMAILLLAIIYTGLSFLGASMSRQISMTATRTELLTEMARRLFGSLGALVLAIAISLACLTTAVGLTSSSAVYFEALFDKKISYRALCIIISLIGVFFAVVGVERLLMVSAPILTVFYPIIIVLVLLNLFDRHIAYRSVYQGASLGALAVSILQGILALEDLLVSLGYQLDLSQVDHIVASLAFSSLGFPWILPALVGGLLGYLYGKRTQEKKDQ